MRMSNSKRAVLRLPIHVVLASKHHCSRGGIGGDGNLVVGFFDDIALGFRGLGHDIG
ncbi:MAG: hypothetical protein ACKJSG_15150 [Lentisphaeria bacterium]